MNNSSTALEDEETSSSRLLSLSVNISMSVVVLAFLCHITSVFTLLRSATQRKKIMFPFMINLNIAALVVSAGDYSVTMGTEFKTATQNGTKTIFLCSWVTFVGVFSKSAYSSSLCLMNIVSTLATDRCSRGKSQQMTRVSTILVFVASWVYSAVLSGVLLVEDSLSALSASQLTCQLNWSSQEKFHFIYNAVVVIATMLLPMVLCFAMQYHCARIWKNFRYNESASLRRGLHYRRKLNRMVIALTLLFFTFELPCQIGNVIAMTTGQYIYTDKVAYALETVSQSNVLYAPWLYIFLNAGYRSALKQLLTDAPAAQSTSGTRGNAPRRNLHQGVGTNRNSDSGTRGISEAKRVKFADNVVAPSPPPAMGSNNISKLTVP